MRRVATVKKRIECELPEGFAIYRLSYRSSNLWRLEKNDAPVCDRTSKFDAIAHAWSLVAEPRPATVSDDGVPADVVARLRAARDDAGRRFG